MRVRWLIAVGLLALAPVSASAEAAPAGLGVTLKAGGSSVPLKATVALNAAAHGLAAGDRVRIVGWRDESANSATTIVTCTKAVCRGQFADQFAETPIRATSP